MRRRSFLGGALAGAAALPAGWGLSRTLRGEVAAQPPGAPKRFLFLTSASGCVPRRYWPSGDARFNYSTEPLERHASDLSIFRGVSMPHQSDHRPYMLYKGLRGRNDDGTPSFDQLLIQAQAEQGYDRAALHSCGQAKRDKPQGTVAFDASGSPMYPIHSPRGAFRSVFDRAPSLGGEATSPTAPMEEDARATVDRLIAQTVDADAAHLESRLSGTYRDWLVQHREALARLAAGFETTGAGNGGAGALPSAACGEGESVFGATDEGSYLERCVRHMHLIAMAFACDARRVASFMLTPLGHDNMNPGDYRGVGYSGLLPGLRTEDQLSGGSAYPTDYVPPGDMHNGRGGTHDWSDNESAAEMIARAHRAEAAVVAYLVDLLKDTPDGSGEGSVFDHTAIYWTNEHAGPNHGVNAGRNEFPTVLIAGSQTGLRVGRYVDLSARGEQANLHGSILLAIADRLGSPIARFGDYTEPYRDIYR